MRTAGNAGGSAPDAMTWLAPISRVAAVEVAHLAGADMRGADRQPRRAAVDLSEVDQFVERLFERRGRIVAGAIGAERMMHAPMRRAGSA